MLTKLEILMWLIGLVNGREGHSDSEDEKVDAAREWLTGLVEHELRRRQGSTSDATS